MRELQGPGRNRARAVPGSQVYLGRVYPGPGARGTSGAAVPDGLRPRDTPRAHSSMISGPPSDGRLGDDCFIKPSPALARPCEAPASPWQALTNPCQASTSPMIWQELVMAWQGLARAWQGLAYLLLWHSGTEFVRSHFGSRFCKQQCAGQIASLPVQPCGSTCPSLLQCAARF